MGFRYLFIVVCIKLHFYNFNPNHTEMKWLHNSHGIEQNLDQCTLNFAFKLWESSHDFGILPLLTNQNLLW